MRWLAASSAFILATMVAAQERSDGGPRPPAGEVAEAPDSGVVILPGARSSPLPALPAPSSKPAGLEDDHRPLLRRAPRPVLPAEFETDSALFCQKRIGMWTEAQARSLFGAPMRERPALDDGKTETGHILAFSDPSGRYRAIELDFARDDGALRTVYVYPWRMTWEDCRRSWGGNVAATTANKGRTFYSYVNRRLDVLVDSAGKVISIGLY